ncbi:MAG TPA: biotin-dependent carboxyltransferase family protein [Stellaceae bacterium]|nr:biotin-dependent carboxyltransferase family protein [Stellaceae bacterium]
MTAALDIIAPGPLTTAQDGGRTGWLRYGVPGSGALDRRALAVANVLVGNLPDAGALEMTLAGGTFAVRGSALRIALAGADMPLAIDGEAASRDRSYTLVPGAVIRVGAARNGARAYLAVAGTFAIAPVFGSVSTHRRAGIGGIDGGALKAGMVLPAAGPPPSGPELRFTGEMPPSARIRIVLGPQDDYFTAAALATLGEAAFTVTPQADRMGLRLAGPPLAHAKGFNIVSDAIAPGSIQVPGDGQPIVLLADRQTTGGYPKIATVISADLPALGQMRPGDSIRFEVVGIAAAVAARRALLAWIAALPQRAVPVTTALASERLLGANLISGVTDGSGA